MWLKSLIFKSWFYKILMITSHTKLILRLRAISEDSTVYLGYRLPIHSNLETVGLWCHWTCNLGYIWTVSWQLCGCAARRSAVFSISIQCMKTKVMSFRRKTKTLLLILSNLPDGYTHKEMSRTFLLENILPTFFRPWLSSLGSRFANGSVYRLFD